MTLFGLDVEPSTLVSILSLIVAICACGLTVIGLVVPARIARKDRQEQRLYDYYVRPRAEAIEEFLRASGDCLMRNTPVQALSRLYQALGVVAYYVTPNTLRLMLDFCMSVHLNDFNRKFRLYLVIVDQLKQDPPRSVADLLLNSKTVQKYAKARPQHVRNDNVQNQVEDEFSEIVRKVFADIDSGSVQNDENDHNG